MTSVFSQINAYAAVTAISGNVLSLTAADQSNDSLKPGERIIIIQMQGATISSSLNNSSFGALASLGSAGLYESAYIAAINSSATSATLSSALTNSYDPSGSLQILSYPQLGTTGYTTSANLIPAAWNGTVGGVIAFSVNGNLVLKDNIMADGKGFRGGAKGGSDGSTCTDTLWRGSVSARAATKGEGLYLTASGEKAGKGKAVNGGGGGTVHNGGGGGGGNFTAGGTGFYGYTGSGCSSTVSAAGLGGAGVTSFIDRIYMGGGGGGGHENNGTGSPGGNGGGIIIVKADSIIVGAACFPLSISANGAAASGSGNDGAGGGGAGGTVLLDVSGIRVSSACPLSVSASGGDGGDVANASSHGGGGGGGQGVVFVTGAGTFSNTTFITTAGLGGNANSSGSPRAEDGAGAAGAGVQLGAANTTLPVRISAADVKPLPARDVEVSWESYCESENEYFEVLHSREGETWNIVGRVNSVATGTAPLSYSLLHHHAPTGDNYYQVKQIYAETSESVSKVLHVAVKPSENTGPYPNPCTVSARLACTAGEAERTRIIGLMGQDVSRFVRKIHRNNVMTIDITDLPEGVYFVDTGLRVYKLLVER